MNIKDKALAFAIKAHTGQVRKSEPDKPMIIHPINVGQMLESYGYNDNVIAAGYLHDVVEDTKYEIEDIKKEFGSEIATLVMSASEPDKSLTWEERKMHTIKNTRDLSLEEKAVICADKISNLEDIYLKFERNGKKDFSSFNRGKKEQKWYYEEIYKALIHNEDETNHMFVKLKDLIDKVFHDKEDKKLKEIFADEKDYYQKLKKIHAKKMEIRKIKTIVGNTTPFVIEFTGTPRTGKTSIINNLYDFFKKGGFKVKIVEEFTTSKYYKVDLNDELSKLSIGERNLKILEYVYKQLCEVLDEKLDVIIIDRSINDRQIWNYMRSVSGDIPKEKYEKVREKYKLISKDKIDFLGITYADAKISLKRDYMCNLALEDRSFLNLENITKYNNSLNNLQDLFKDSVDNYLLLDTSNITVNDSAINFANSILDAMKVKYLEEFKKMYKID